MIRGHTRSVLIIGAGFVVTAIAYAGLAVPLGYHIEWAGVTMLGALGIALGLMAYVLLAGSEQD